MARGGIQCSAMPLKNKELRAPAVAHSCLCWATLKFAIAPPTLSSCPRKSTASLVWATPPQQPLSSANATALAPRLSAPKNCADEMFELPCRGARQNHTQFDGVLE